MQIGCLPFLIMLLALAAGYVMFGIPGVVIFAATALLLLHFLP